jgi:hypothetical protein
MTAWATIRNMDIDESSQINRTYQILAFLDLYLVSTLGWTRKGTGGGAAQATTWGAATELALYPSITSPKTMAADCWGVWQNPDGVQLCCKCEAAATVEFWVSPGGNFVQAGTSNILPPSETGSAPADMITFPGTDWGGAGTNKITLAYSSDYNSVILFGRRGAPNDEMALIFTKLEDTKTADALPTHYPYWFYIKAASGADVWASANLSGGTGAAGFSYHPTQGVKEYCIIEAASDAGTVFTSAPVDPISGNAPRMESLVACVQPSSFHIRGTVPGVFRVSTALHNSGDRLDINSSGEYDWIVMGDYAVPWFSSDALQW